MRLAVLQDFLMWCTIINYIVLMIWFIAFYFAHDLVYKIHAAWFELSIKEFDKIHYQLMGFYKIGILLLNLAPYIAIRIINS